MDRLKRVIVEVHRRSLWQVLGIYAVGSWIAYQVILALVDGLALPEWVPGVAIVLILLGLPVVLATAFVQEGLPSRGAERAAAPDIDPTLFPQVAAADYTTLGDAAADRALPRRGLERALTWRRSLGAGTLAFALLGLGRTGWVGMRALGVGPWGSLVAARVLEPGDRILIADFDVRGADSTLAAIVTEAFRIDFSRSTLVRAAEPTTVREVLRRMDRADVTRVDGELAREIALRAGIPIFLTGEVAAAAGGFVLTARLLSTESGELLAAQREQAADEKAVIGAIDRAVAHLERAVAADTGRFFGYVNLGEALVLQGRLEEARQRFEQAVARAPESVWPAVDLALAPYVAGDYEEAEANLRRLAENVSASAGMRARARQRLIHVELVRGHIAHAEREIETMARGRGDPREVERQLSANRFYTAYFLLQQPQQARELLGQARRLIAADAANDTSALIEIAYACSVVEDLACAREHLAKAGDHAGALRHFRSISDRLCPRCEEPLAGRVFEHMAQPDSAIDAYERYLAAPALDRVFPDAFDLVPTHERLARLYEQRGDRTRAAHHYGRIVAIWKDADPELQPRVAEARRRLTLIQPDR